MARFCTQSVDYYRRLEARRRKGGGRGWGPIEQVSPSACRHMYVCTPDVSLLLLTLQPTRVHQVPSYRRRRRRTHHCAAPPRQRLARIRGPPAAQATAARRAESPAPIRSQARLHVRMYIRTKYIRASQMKQFAEAQRKRKVRAEAAEMPVASVTRVCVCIPKSNPPDFEMSFGVRSRYLSLTLCVGGPPLTLQLLAVDRQNGDTDWRHEMAEAAHLCTIPSRYSCNPACFLQLDV